MHPFVEQLAHDTLVCDGAMGSMVARAFPHESPLALARDLLETNLTHPEVVQQVHMAYIAAGARVVTTNTFGASRARLDRLGLGPQAAAIVSAGVKIARDAREASGRPVWIAGSIGPLSPDWILDTGPDAEEQIRQFQQQCEILLDRGVDVVLLETFSRLDQLLLAIQAVRGVSSDVPLLASVSFDEHGELEDGEDGRLVVERVQALDAVQVLGVNCSLGPQASLAVLETLARGTELPLSIMPNAGFAQRLGGRVLYPDMSRGYYERFTREALDLGARLIGGCCGTTPEQIRVIGETLASTNGVATRPPRRIATVGVEPAADELVQPTDSRPSRFTQRLQAGEFVRSLQIDPQRGPQDLLNREVAAAVRDSGLVDVVDINSSGGSARQDSLQIAAGIERLGVETLPHITPRDASLQGILAQVLGAYDWGGIRNVLVIVGDPPKGDLYAEAKGVYQVDTIGLVRALDRLRRGHRVQDRVTVPPFDLGIGVALNQNAPDVEEELQRLERKIEAGADFVMTQPFFDYEDWERFRDRHLNGRFSLPILLGIWPLVSARQAQRVNENVAGVVIPESICKRLEAAGTAARTCGADLAAELVARLESERAAAGVYVVAPFKQPTRGLDIFQRVGKRA